MHSYTGTASSFHAAITIIDDSDSPNASNFNTAPEALGDNTAFLFQASIADATKNWLPTQGNITAGTGSCFLYGGAWDGLFQQWIELGKDSSTSTIQSRYSQNAGLTWVEFTSDFTATFTPIAGQCIGINPSGNIAVARNDGSGSNYASTKISAYDGGAYVDAVQNAFKPSVGAPLLSQGAIFFFGTAFYLVGASGAGTGTTVGVAAVSPSGDGTGTWATFTSSLPAGWQNGTTNITGWLVALSPTDAVVASCGLTPGGSDRSLLLHMTSAAPTTPTDITPAILTSGTEHVRGLAYSATDGLWGLLTSTANSGSGTAKLYTSPDLATWTKVATLATTQAVGLAATQSIWTLLIKQKFSNQNIVLVSNNVARGAGNVTWQAGNLVDATPAAGGRRAVATFLSSGAQLLAADNQLGGGVSNYVTISRLAGAVFLTTTGWGTSP
jgi:hypothetical protein